MTKLKALRNKTLKTGDRNHMPLPTGRYAKVGYRDIMVGYSRKAGVLLRLFYPHKQLATADEAAAGPDAEHNPLLWSNWLPHPAYKQGLVDVANIRSETVVSILEYFNKDNAFTPALANAKPFVGAPADRNKHPAIVFCHGLGGFRNVHSTLCTELASHGFVVAAVEHRDNSSCLSFYAQKARYSFKSSNPDFYHDQVDGAPGDDGDVVDADDAVDFGDELDDPNYVPPKALEPMSNAASHHLELQWVRFRQCDISAHTEQTYKFRNRQVHQRVRECSRALDVLEALNAGFELSNLLDPSMNVREFEGMIDMDRISVMGHSFGGATALLAAATEMRFKAVVALDPWAYPIKDEPLDMITQPVLSINTETLTADKPNKKKLRELLNVLEGDDVERRQAVTLNGSSHVQQSDVPFVMSRLAMLLGGFPVGLRAMGTITVHDLSARLAMDFIAKYLDIELDKEVADYVKEQKHRFRPTYSK